MPPDTQGWGGQNHFTVLHNGGYRLFDKTGAQIVAEYKARNPGKEWPRYDVGSMFANLFTKPPGWRAAEGHSQPALGYPQ
mgnify:CR=1 FL=1